MPEFTDNVHTSSFLAPSCETCGCSLTEADRREFEAENGEGYPANHYDCAEILP